MTIIHIYTRKGSVHFRLMEGSATLQSPCSGTVYPATASCCISEHISAIETCRAVVVLYSNRMRYCRSRLRLDHTLFLLPLETVGDHLVWCHELLETEPRSVDWGLASVDESVVEESTNDTSAKWRDDGYPEVVVSGSPDIGAVAKACSHDTWAKITRWVDGETGLRTEGNGNASLEMMLVMTQVSDNKMNTHKSEEETKWEPGAGCDKLALVRIVLERKDDENQDGGADELVKELAGCAKHGAWVCCEDASGRGLGRCNSAVRVICIDQAVVVAIDDTSSAECTKELGEPVHGETSPWKLAEHARCEADSWVQECTRVTSDVDTQHEADTPSEGDSGPVSEAISTWCGSIIGSEKCLCESGITWGSQSVRAYQSTGR